MQLAISQVNDICDKLQDNVQLESLIPPQPAPTHRPPLYSAKGIKNTRRHMEDRHIVLDDFNAVFGIKVMGTFTTLSLPFGSLASALISCTSDEVINNNSRMTAVTYILNVTEPKASLIFYFDAKNCFFIVFFFFRFGWCFLLLRLNTHTGHGSNQLLWYIRWTWRNRCCRIYCITFTLWNSSK